MTESTIRSIITPPQAWQGVGRKAKPRRKLLKLVGPQDFHEDVDRYKIGVDMSKIDIR